MFLGKEGSGAELCFKEISVTKELQESLERLMGTCPPVCGMLSVAAADIEGN